MIREEKGIKGITLIALIITIIILLILASVSVATLVGENGIITRAREAKEKTERAEIIEKVKIDILEAQIGSNGDITNAQLQTILTKYFKDIPDTLPKDLTTLTLITKDEYGTHYLDISEIYQNEILLKASDLPSPESRKHLIGSKVNNYAPTDSNLSLGWSLFYADGENFYLRSDEMLDPADCPPGRSGSVARSVGGSAVPDYSAVIADYDGLSDITDSFLRSFNSKMFAAEPSLSYDNAKMIAYMFDTAAWSVFCSPEAEFACGGPSLEFVLKSYDEKYNTKYLEKCEYVPGGGDKGYWIAGFDCIRTQDPLFSERSGSATVYASYIASPSGGEQCCQLKKSYTKNV